MASAIQIDTLAFSKSLREAGAEERLAEAIVEGITAADTSELTTKSDLAEVKTELKQDIAEVRTEIAVVRTEMGALKAELKQDIAEVKAELKQDIAVVRTEIAQLATGFYRQMWVMGVGIVGLVFTLGKLFP